MNTVLAGRLRRQETSAVRVVSPREARDQEPAGQWSDRLLVSIDISERKREVMKRRSGEGGIAMIVVLLMMLLVSTLLVGFTASVMSDQHFRFIDREHIQAFYAAHAGIEKLTTDLGNMFQTNFAPKAADISAVFATP